MYLTISFGGAPSGRPAIKLLANIPCAEHTLPASRIAHEIIPCHHDPESNLPRELLPHLLRINRKGGARGTLNRRPVDQRWAPNARHRLWPDFGRHLLRLAEIALAAHEQGWFDWRLAPGSPTSLLWVSCPCHTGGRVRKCLSGPGIIVARHNSTTNVFRLGAVFIQVFSPFVWPGFRIGGRSVGGLERLATLAAFKIEAPLLLHADRLLLSEAAWNAPARGARWTAVVILMVAYAMACDQCFTFQ